MSVCLEPSAVLPTAVSSTTESDSLQSKATISSSIQATETHNILTSSQPNIAKLVLTNSLASTGANSTSVLQKVPTSSVITVVNATGPLTILKTLCSNSCGTSTPQFTLVNSTPLSVCNAAGKPITVVGAPPITVVRAISNINSAPQISDESTKINDSVSNNACAVSSVNGTLTVNTDRPAMHNVFVKNTNIPPDLVPASSETPQVHKLANSFLQNNLLQTVTSNNTTKPVGCQKGTVTGMATSGKLKIISNVIVPPTPIVTASGSSNIVNNSNIILNKSVPPKHYIQQKTLNSSLNGTPKFVNRSATVTNSFIKTGPSSKNILPNKNQKLVYPTHKSRIRTMPSTTNSIPKPGIKTLSPQSKGISNQQIQRTSSGLRTIPPQRPSNKPNYIGKHALQAQKFKTAHTMGKLKNVKPPVPTVNNVFPHRTPQSTGVIYHQALTANIIQSLSENTSRSFDFNSRYEGNNNFNESRSPSYSETYAAPPPKPQSNPEALSFVCRAILLDHNYSATPPAEPLRNVPATPTPVQLNGTNVGAYYSPTGNRSLGGSTNTPTMTSISSSSVLPSNSSSGVLQDDDAGSDISCISDHKAETEGEETDTAPEAELVTNEENYDHYGDYVTRCICGFLHDDGYMIECDKCKVWQHVRCVIKNNKKVPDDYLCEICDPDKPVDKGKARTLQQQWMRENQEREAKLRKEVRLRELKIKETLSDSDSSDGEAIGNNLVNKNRVGPSRRKPDQLRLNPRQRREPSKGEQVTRRNIKRKERKIPKKKPKIVTKNHSDDEMHDSWTHSTFSQMPQLRQWIEHYEEAVTNHYSPELRARISSLRMNGTHHSDVTSLMDSTVHKCRIFTQPLTGFKYLVSTMILLPNIPIIELRGKYMLSTQHKSGPVGHGGALTTRQHAQRPGPFLFFYRLQKDNTEVCVDTRTYGNDARFIRRSCKPNAELRHCIEKGVLHLYIVTVNTVEKNMELTIKHESHDLAVVGTTHVACACGKPDECNVNKGPVKKNGEIVELSGLRKRRGRRMVSSASEQEPIIVPVKIKEEIIEQVIPEIKPPVEIKVEPDINPEEIDIKPEETVIKKEEDSNLQCIDTEIVKQEEIDENTSPSSTISTRKTSLPKSDTEDKKESQPKECNTSADKRKLSREERKIEAIMKAFERMERQEQRKQEHQAKQAHRRESEPTPITKDDDKSSEPKIKRRRRKGRARTVSTNSQSRRNRLNSADSSYATSGDECLLSPNDNIHHSQMLRKDLIGNLPIKETGLLLTCDNSHRNDLKSPIPDVDCNSNSANSSPETPLSSACLLVAAAVEPLEPNFKFPKTKKGLMNEWINKSTECIQSASSISPSSLTPHIAPPPETNFYEGASSTFFSPPKSIAVLTQAASYCDMPSQPHGNAKKRWLRQAISEDHCDSPSSRPESPPLPEMVAPPKKRRLPRESLSTETSPPTTPTSMSAPLNPMTGDEGKRFPDQEDRVEIVTPQPDGDSPTRVIIDDATLKERVAEMQQEIGSCFRLPEPRESPQKEITVPPPPLRCVLDPRLSRSMFNNSEHLVATVEKNLSILGLEEHKNDCNMPIKRKLSITEYRQRKRLNVNEKMSEENPSEENTSSQSPPQKLRARSDSASSATSFLSSDDEVHPPELPQPKALSAFNSEPTELEKQRESVSLRLKKAFGLTIDEESRKAVLNMETIMTCDFDPQTKPSVQKYSPTFPLSNICIATSESVFNPSEKSPQPAETEDAQETETSEKQEEKSELTSDKNEPVASPPETSVSNKEISSVHLELFYTPDEEYKTGQEPEVEEPEKAEEYNVESTNYVPPFNNPLYPNSSFTSFGSVIDDDAPYEGRNPSPPPEMSSAPSAYSSP